MIYEEYAVNGVLIHHGIKGQHWGTRNGPPYPLSAGAHSASEKKAAKVSGHGGININIKTNTNKKKADEAYKKREARNIEYTYGERIKRVDKRLNKLKKAQDKTTNQKRIDKLGKSIQKQENAKKYLDALMKTELKNLKMTDVSTDKLNKGKHIAKSVLQGALIGALLSPAGGAIYAAQASANYRRISKEEKQALMEKYLKNK